MGVVNATPDSFFDGGTHFDAAAATAAALGMMDQGAAIVDVGGESTRPGSEGTSAEEELRRVLPVVEGLHDEVPLSIDTSKARMGCLRAASAVEFPQESLVQKQRPLSSGSRCRKAR